MKPILIVLNGSLHEQEIDMINPDKYEHICCADGAYDKIKNAHIDISYILGDFDSLVPYEKTIKHIELQDQDYTDFEKILVFFKEKKYQKFHVIGCSGEEQDHFLGHLSIAKKFMNEIHILFFDRHHQYFVTNQDIELNQCIGKTISIIPLPEVYGLSYKGLKYPLENAHMVFGEQVGTRNRGIEDNVKITFESGCIAIFKEH